MASQSPTHGWSFAAILRDAPAFLGFFDAPSVTERCLGWDALVGDVPTVAEWVRSPPQNRLHLPSYLTL
jgi:hypothetical protein